MFIFDHRKYSSQTYQNLSEEEIALLYNNAMKTNDGSIEKKMSELMLSKWTSRIKTINFRVWSLCRGLDRLECAGSYDNLGILFEPSYYGLLGAMERYDGKKSFAPFAWKTVYGKCMNYCTRKCYIGIEIMNRLPDKIKSADFEKYKVSGTEELGYMLNSLYPNHRGGYRMLSKNNITILKSRELSSFLRIYEEDYESNPDDKKVNFMNNEESFTTGCIESIIKIIKEFDLFYKMLIYRFTIEAINQKSLCMKLNISEPNFTRKLNDIEEKISSGLMYHYPESVPLKMTKDRFDRMLNDKKITLRQRKNLLRIFLPDGDYYIHDEKKYGSKDKAELISILSKTGRKVRLRDLKKIHYFCERMREEFGNF